MPLSHDQLRRYGRQTILPEIGEEGQEKLQQAHILVIGAGGLGSPALLYLAASGAGRLSIIDDDRVELSNLQRQVLHETEDIGRPKPESALDALHDLNPDIHVHTHTTRLTNANAADLISESDIVLDGSDNFPTRFLVHQHCYESGKPLVSAAIRGFEGQLSVWKGYLGAPHPCYRCFHPEAPPEDTGPQCAEEGVLGPVAGVMGCLQATETIKELLGLGESLSGYLLRYDALSAQFRKLKIHRDPACPCCA